jgi:hypothetical protein
LKLYTIAQKQNTGGTEWNVGSCTAMAAPTVIVPSPPAVAPPLPTRPTATIGSYECDYENDSCLLRFDGVCDAGTAFCKTGSDCFDCDPCQTLRYGGCNVCTAAGCLWCGAEALCLSTTTNVLVPVTISCTAADFVNTCEALESTDDDQFSDPLRESQNWALEQVNIKAAWDMGYSTFLLFLHHCMVVLLLLLFLFLFLFLIRFDSSSTSRLFISSFAMT